MPMPVWVGTFPKNFPVFFLIPLFSKKLMRCAKALSSCYIDHIAKIRYTSQKRVSGNAYYSRVLLIFVKIIHYAVPARNSHSNGGSRGF